MLRSALEKRYFWSLFWYHIALFKHVLPVVFFCLYNIVYDFVFLWIQCVCAYVCAHVGAYVYVYMCAHVCIRETEDKRKLLLCSALVFFSCWFYVFVLLNLHFLGERERRGERKKGHEVGCKENWERSWRNLGKKKNLIKKYVKIIKNN